MAISIRERSLDEIAQMLGQAQPGSIIHNECSAELLRRQFLNSQRSTTVAIWAAVASALSALAAVVSAYIAYRH